MFCAALSKATYNALYSVTAQHVVVKCGYKKRYLNVLAHGVPGCTGLIHMLWKSLPVQQSLQALPYRCTLHLVSVFGFIFNI